MLCCMGLGLRLVLCGFPSEYLELHARARDQVNLNRPALRVFSRRAPTIFFQYFERARRMRSPLWMNLTCSTTAPATSARSDKFDNIRGRGLLETRPDDKIPLTRSSARAIRAQLLDRRCSVRAFARSVCSDSGFAERGLLSIRACACSHCFL